MIGLGRRVMTVAVAGLCLLGLGGAVSVAAATTTAGPVPAFSCGGFDHWISALAGTHFSATAALGPTTATLEGTISDVLFTRQIVSPTLAIRDGHTTVRSGTIDALPSLEVRPRLPRRHRPSRPTASSSRALTNRRRS